MSVVWSSPEDYQSAVQNPKRYISDTRLHSAQVETRKLGVLTAPYPRSGNFGAVYKFINQRQAYALKVFLKTQPDREQRYQHPKRYRGYFDERLDHFAALVILLSLASLNRARWQRYHTDDNCLIVKESDLLDPAQSPMLTELSQSADAPLRKLASLLRAASGSLNAISPFGQVVADPDP